MRSVLIAVCVLGLLTLLACGNGGNKQTPPPAITSEPPLSATEGVAYSYAISASDPSGKPLKFSLVTAPAGAQLDGNTVVWTPLPSQSRQPNSFSVRVTNSKGVSATQSWTIAPAGTVQVSWIDTLWDEQGQHSLIHKWLGAGALVPQADGSFLALIGSDGGGGTLTISNVPAGYFWLQATHGSFYWTKSSNIDLGTDMTEPTTPGLIFTTGSTQTPVVFKVTGFEPGPFAGLELYSHELPFNSLAWEYFGNASSQSFTVSTNSNLDYSQIRHINAREYKSAPLGTGKAFVLGPTADLKNLALKNGELNKVDVVLAPGPPKSIDLNLRGSAWRQVFDRVGPGTAVPLATPFALSVQPNLLASGIRVTPRPRSSVELISSAAELRLGPGLPPFYKRSFPARCAASFRQEFAPIPDQDILMQDDIFEGLEYQDPFPPDSSRQFVVCQQALVDLPAIGSVTPQVLVTNGAAFTLPMTEISPLIGPVEDPTINDQSLFTAVTLSPGKSNTLKWREPSVGKATGFIVDVFTPHAFTQSVAMLQEARLSTATTAITLPANLLQNGTTYYFVITAITDGRAKMESSPNRLGFPAGNADVVSGAITVLP